MFKEGAPCGLLSPKVKRKHWFQNVDVSTHAHGIQVIRGGRGQLAGLGFTLWTGHWDIGGTLGLLLEY